MFKITNWGAEITNAKSILGGICYYRYFNENNNDITASGYFPATLGLKVGDRIWAIPSDTDSIDELYVVTAVSAGVPTVAKASGSSIDLANIIETTTELPAADFVLYLKEGGERYNEITHGTLTYDGSIWVLKGYDRNNVEVMKLQEYTEDLQDFGCVFASDTHTEGDNCSFAMTTEISGQKWEQQA